MLNVNVERLKGHYYIPTHSDTNFHFGKIVNTCLLPHYHFQYTDSMAITHADLNELLQLKKEVEPKITAVRSDAAQLSCIGLTSYSQDPFRVVDMVIEIQTERRKVTEAMSARDAVVQRLAEAYESLHQKTVLIEHLQQQIQQEPRGDSPFPFKMAPSGEKVEILRMKDEILRSGNTIKDLRDEIKFLKEAPPGLLKSLDPPPSYEEGALKVCV